MIHRRLSSLEYAYDKSLVSAGMAHTSWQVL